MKFTNILYYMISINLAIIVFSSLGVWSSSITVLSLDTLKGVFGGTILGFAGGMGGAAVFGKYVNLERKLGFFIVSLLYGAITGVTYGMINSINIYIQDYLNISTFFLIIIILVYIVAIIQLVFGGFKSYE